MQQCHIVADGAGLRGLYAFAGAITEIQQHYEIKNFAGVSAGAVVGALVKIGLLNTNEYLSNKKIVNVAYDQCLKSTILEGWSWPKGLQVFVSNLNTGKSEVFDHNTRKNDVWQKKYSQNLILWKVLLKSMNLNIVDQYYDGTITSNFPYIGGLNKTTNIPTFGLFLHMDERPEFYLENSQNPTMEDVFRAHFNYVDAQRIHKEHLPKTVRRIIYIPVMNIKATDLNLTDEQKEKLYDNGQEAAREFLNYDDR
jgi:NTE family protein